MAGEGFIEIAQSFQDLASGKIARELKIDRDKAQAAASAYDRGFEAGQRLILDRMPPKTRERYSKPKPIKLKYKAISAKDMEKREVTEQISNYHKAIGKPLGKKALRKAVRNELEYREVQRILRITANWKL